MPIKMLQLRNSFVTLSSYLNSIGQCFSCLAKMCHSGFFKQILQFLQQINVKNVHQVYGAEIQTHNHGLSSLIP